MKRTLLMLGFGFAFSVFFAAEGVAATADVQLDNQSIRMHPGDCSCGFGLKWTLYFSSFYTENPPSANGEMAIWPQPAPYNHYSYLVLLDPSTVASTTFAGIDLPTADGNNDGTPDFFQSGFPVATTTTGYYENIWGNGQLSLQWTRNAGSTVGSCVVTMIDPILGILGPYNHVFELNGYSGDLTYTPGANTVVGTVHLAKNGGGEALSGPLALVKASTNRFNQLLVSSGMWTNDSVSFNFVETELTRDPSNANVYHGVLANPGGSYHSWRLVITDNNDANGNGIPDLSDDLSLNLPRRPSLMLTLQGEELALRIGGDINRTHLVQEAAQPNALNWTTVRTLSLTSDPQIILLPRPTQSPVFWRVMAQ